MKKIFVLCSLLFPLVCNAQFRTSVEGLEDSETVSAMKENVSYFASSALEGRKAGSEGEADAAEYFTEKLAAYGVDILTGKEGGLFGMKQADGDTLRSHNVIGAIQGYDKSLRDHYIVIGARMDNLGSYDLTNNGEKLHRVYYGANGNGSGMALLLELARMLQTNSVLLKRSVLICGFGSSLESNAGAWYMLNRSFPAADKIDAMVNLDMVGTASNGFYAYTASNPDMNAIVNALSSTLQPIQPQIVTMEPVASDHRAFYDRSIPSIMFTTGMFSEYGTDRDTADILEYDGMERILEYVYNYTIALVNGNKPSFNVAAEEKKTSGTLDDVVPFYDCDYKPTFLGSNDPSNFMKKWVYVYLKYPQEAIENGIQGRVLVSFVIDERGKVGDVKVRKGVDPLLDDEAVRVISASPDWKPGRVRGQKVKTEISLYVEFKLVRKK